MNNMGDTDNMDVDEFPMPNYGPILPGYSGDQKKLADFMSDVSLSFMKIIDMSSRTVKGTVHGKLETQSEMKPLEFPTVIKMVTVTGMLNLSNYNLIFIPLRRLQILEIGLQQLETMSNPLAWLHFPELKALKIGTFNGVPVDSLGRPALPQTHVTQLMTLLRRVELPMLMSFSLSSPYLPGLERSWADCLLNFLTKHQKTLRHLIMYCTVVKEPIGGPPPTDTWSHVPSYPERLTALTMNLYHYYVYFTQGGPGPDIAPLYEYIGVTQTFLRTHVTLYQGLPLFSKSQFLQNNSASLLRLTLNVDPSKPLNCLDLSNCRSLQSLVLAGPPKTQLHYETENFNDCPASSELKNLRFLPTSLRYLQIVNLFIETSELTCLPTLLPRLDRLNLLGIGEKEDLGMTLDIFCQLIFRKGMIEVGVFRGFNKKRIKQDNTPGTGDSFGLANLALMGAATRNGPRHSSFDSIAAIQNNPGQLADGHIDQFFLLDCRKHRMAPQLLTGHHMQYDDYDFNLHFNDVREYEGHIIFTE